MSQYHKPSGALGKMHQSVHELDPINWQAADYDRAWAMGREEMRYDILLLALDKMPEHAAELKTNLDKYLKK